jgi:uncharacterized protein
MSVGRMVGLALVPLLAVGLVIGAIAAVPDPEAGAAPNNFVTMPDGVQIAIKVRLPDHYQPGHTYPTRFEMSGNDGRQTRGRSNDEFVIVHASARGTGASGGEIERSSYKRAEDGKFIIDQYIVLQPWSNGDVTITADRRASPTA